MQLVHQFLTTTAARSPEATALIADEKATSFAQLDAWSDKVACALHRIGLRRGDRVVLLLENSPQLVAAFFGVLKAGGVFVVLNPTTKAQKLAYVLGDSGAKILIAAGRLEGQVSAATESATWLEQVVWVGGAHDTTGANTSFAAILDQPDRKPDDPGLIDVDLATVIYTSGSTGEPKGVMLTHRNMANTAWSISTYLENVPEDVVACVLPLSFDYGLYQVITGARVGFTVLLERSFAYPYDILLRMAKHRVTGLPGVPTIFARLLDMAPFDGIDLSSLRYLTNTAAVLPLPHIRRLQEMFHTARLYSMYGLTECTRVSYLDPDRLHDKAHSVGKAMPNSEAYVVDENGQRVGPGVVGELVIRGANVMRGYWRKPEETARTLRPGEIPGEPLLYSGDRFYMDEEGFLFFVGREDDIFKCRGEKISPREIEGVLCALDGVAQAAVVGVEDPIDGQAVKAFVVPRTGSEVSERRVRAHCRAHLENYMLPKYVAICSELPSTGTGKVSTRLLREQGASVEPCAE